MNAGFVGRTGRFLSENRWRLALLALYAGIVGSAIASHAMWRDELQAWLIARDSFDLAGLLANMRYEGHPALWHLLLMPLAHLTGNPAAMQVLHYAIAVSTVGLVLFLAPLSRLERLLFPFGYYMLFEYAVKSRSYALGCLLVTVFCALWRSRRQHPLVLALVLALLANVHVLFLIVSGAGLCALIIDRLAGPGPVRIAWRHDLPALAIVLLGWAAAAFTAFPPPDTGVATLWFFGFSLVRMAKVVGTLAALFSPTPSVVAAVAAIAALALPFWLTWRSASARVFLLASMFGILAFYYVKFPDNGVWHRGPLFFVWFAAIWLERSNARTAEAPDRALPRASHVALVAALASQAWFGVTAVRKDMRQPMSNAASVARFIGANHWQDDTLAGMPDYALTPVIGYLGIARGYFPQGDRWGSFTIWDQARAKPVDVEAVLKRLSAQTGGVILLLGKGTEIDPALLAKYGFAEAARFEGAGVKDENYVLYRRP